MNVLLILLFLVGLGIMLYPFVCNWWYQIHANDDMSAYTAAVQQGDPAEYDAERERAREYNEILVGQTVPDVFAIREGTTDPEYESFLNVRKDLMMGTLRIPCINVHLPIYHYSDEVSLQKGCGHIFGSSLPVGGESTHAVITAHRGLPTAELFSDLDQVHEGDQFFLEVLNETLAYEVDQVEVVEPHDTRSLAIDRGKDLVTLVTCTPYGVNTKRLLVRGHRVPYVPGAENASDDGFRLQRTLSMLLKVGAVALGAIAALLVVHFLNKRRRRREEAALEAAGVVGAVGVEQLAARGPDEGDGRRARRHDDSAMTNAQAPSEHRPRHAASRNRKDG